MADPQDIRELAGQVGLGLNQYKPPPWAGKRFGPPTPDWKDKALDELAGPHHALIPLLAEMAYSREMGPPVNTELGLVNRLIEGLESGAGWKPGDPSGPSWEFGPIYQRLLDKEGELRLDKYKEMPDPIADASRNRAELVNYQAVPPAPPSQPRKGWPAQKDMQPLLRDAPLITYPPPPSQTRMEQVTHQAPPGPSYSPPPPVLQELAAQQPSRRMPWMPPPPADPTQLESGRLESTYPVEEAVVAGGIPRAGKFIAQALRKVLERQLGEMPSVTRGRGEYPYGGVSQKTDLRRALDEGTDLVRFDYRVPMVRRSTLARAAAPAIQGSAWSPQQSSGAVDYLNYLINHGLGPRELFGPSSGLKLGAP